MLPPAFQFGGEMVTYSDIFQYTSVFLTLEGLCYAV